jgi:micrococcal nuclease
VDGDTFRVHLHGIHPLWSDPLVRIRGVNAGELHTPECEAERQAGIEARATLEHRIGGARRIDLLDVSLEKYGGRIAARVIADGVDVGDYLVTMGLAVPYDGTGPRPHPWCKP